MGSGIAQRFPLIEAGTDDFIVAHDDGSNRYFPDRLGSKRLRNGGTHPMFICFEHRHNIPFVNTSITNMHSLLTWCEQLCGQAACYPQSYSHFLFLYVYN
jgi:hypothetical protein